MPTRTTVDDPIPRLPGRPAASGAAHRTTTRERERDKTAPYAAAALVGLLGLTLVGGAAAVAIVGVAMGGVLVTGPMPVPPPPTEHERIEVVIPDPTSEPVRTNWDGAVFAGTPTPQSVLIGMLRTHDNPCVPAGTRVSVDLIADRESGVRLEGPGGDLERCLDHQFGIPSWDDEAIRLTTSVDGVWSEAHPGVWVHAGYTGPTTTLLVTFPGGTDLVQMFGEHADVLGASNRDAFTLVPTGTYTLHTSTGTTEVELSGPRCTITRSEGRTYAACE